MKTKQYFDGSIIRKRLANTPQITFEVTDACNLNCVYCGYGKLYGNHDDRENKKLDIFKATNFLDYVVNLWDSPLNQSYNKTITLSFYGGEPLLNMPFIQAVVDYSKNIQSKTRNIIFSMTTNGLLLHKFIDFLVENEFSLLISLDGDVFCNSYRVYKDGQESYKKVVDNIHLIRSKFPDYFVQKVRFNAVLHNRNSLAIITRFFRDKYSKVPSIGALNDVGIRPEMQHEFMKMYHNTFDSLFSAENYGELESELFLSAPTYRSATVYLFQSSENIFNNYNELLFGKSNKTKSYPTGTCIPFNKKVFVTVNGKILPCERIGHQFALGSIDKDKIHLNFDEIAKKFNLYFSKIDRLCAKCHNLHGCFQCIFYIQNLDDGNCVCPSFMNKDAFQEYENQQLSFFARHPEVYSRIMNDVIYR